MTKPSPSLDVGAGPCTEEFLRNPCGGCGSTTFTEGDWRWLSPSDHVCTNCRRCDNQLSIQECDGEECSALCHRECMVQVSADMFVCKACVDAGDPAEDEELGSE